MHFFFDNLHLVSINAAKTVSRQGRITKTSALRAMQREIEMTVRAQLPGQSLIVDRRKEGISVTITSTIESSKFFTKEGLMSLTSGDIDMSIKYIIDSIFSCLDCNDAQIIDLIVKKRCGHRESLTVTIDVVNL
jgi:Holliday junction resolvase RusA-like endonuclease